MELRLLKKYRSENRGYAAFLTGGVCVALNLISYLPARTFEQAEVTEFTVTLVLLTGFAIFTIVASSYALRNRQEPGLVALFLLSVAFILLICFGGSFDSMARSGLQLCYAIIVLGIASTRLLMFRRSAT